ncbi:MAG TPA: PAS domain S-box protein [Roseiflexaceae bacterium]|nr:PAS domain S-box protein [Roseiflexaceae bacterium]
MNPASLNILLIEHDRASAGRIGTLISVGHAQLATMPAIQIVRAASLVRAHVLLRRFSADLILLSLPATADVDRALTCLRTSAPQVPVILINRHTDELLGLHALQAGATDYLVADQLSPYTLVHAILHAAQNGSMQRQLRESELRYRRLVEHLPDLIYRYRLIPPRGFEFVNAAAEAITGYTPQEHYDDPDLGMKIIHPEDRALLTSVAHGEHSTGEPLVLRWFKKDGSLIWIEQHNTVIHAADGTPIAIEGVARNITRRKQAEAMLRLHDSALNAAANAVVITDSDGTIQWVNPAFTHLTGYSAAEAIGRNPRMLKSGRHGKAFYQQLWQTLQAGDVWHGELVNRRKDGTLYDEEQTITPIRDAQGRIAHYTAIKQNITARKAADEAATRRLAELEALNRISTALRTVQTLDAMLPALLDETLAALQCTTGAIWLYQPETATSYAMIARGWFEPLQHIITVPVADMLQFLSTNQPIYQVADLAADPHISPQVAAQIPAGWGGIYIPIHTTTNIKACMAIALPYPRTMTREEQSMLGALAEMAGTALHRLQLHQETVRRLEQLQTLRIIDMAITSNQDSRVTFDILLEQVMLRLGVDAAGMLLFNPTALSLEYAAGRGFRSHRYERSYLRLGEGLAGRCALERQRLADENLTMSPYVERRDLILHEQFRSYIGVPLIARGQIKGVLEIFHRTTLHPNPEWIDFLETLAGQAAIAIDHAHLFEDLQQSHTELILAYDTTIEGWSHALDLRDHETEGHTLRVTEMTIRLARAAGMNEEEVAHVRRGTLLHDIGKVGIPDSILLKPGPLTEEEWVVMRRHPQYAYELLAPIPYLHPALDIPYCHHERWDGSGYPRGLTAKQIPLAARLFAVVDVWDALRSDRPYRRGWPEAQVRAHIQSLAGTHFDPMAVRLFFEVLDE